MQQRDERKKEQYYLRFLKLKLWINDPICKYCGIETVIADDSIVESGKPVPPNVATIDHKYSRYNPNRKLEKQEFILCCNLCNNYRAQIEEDKIPIEELRERSGRGRIKNRPTETDIIQTQQEINTSDAC